MVVTNFFRALDALIIAGRIKGVATFCRRYGINRRNLYQLKADPSRRIFDPDWLSYLVSDYGVRADYLLTGQGSPLKSRFRANSVQRLKTEV